MGYLYRRGKTWYIGYQDHTGQWVRKSTHVQFKAAAEAKLKQTELKAAKGEIERAPITLKDFLQRHLEAQRPTIEPETYDRYQDCLDNLVDTGSPLSGLTVTKVTIGACSEYVSWRLAGGRSKGTVDKEVGWLKAALTEAARQDLVSWEVIARIRDEISSRRLPALRKAHKRRERVLLPVEIPVLFEAAESNTNLQDALTVAFWTGLRQENILELTEGQVDFTCDPAVARFVPEEMKNDAGHLVSLAPAAREVLWRRWQGDPKKTRRPFFFDFRPAWKRLKAKLEISLPDFRFHDLRRTYITYRLAAGIDPKTVQDEVGHQDSRMTMDCYGRALRDPGVRAWAVRHFRFPWDPAPHAVKPLTNNSQEAVEACKWWAVLGSNQ
jgi:integrase